MNIFDDLFVPNKNDFPKEIEEIEKFGIIEEEEKRKEKRKKEKKEISHSTGDLVTEDQ